MGTASAPCFLQLKRASGMPLEAAHKFGCFDLPDQRRTWSVDVWIVDEHALCEPLELACWSPLCYAGNAYLAELVLGRWEGSWEGLADGERRNELEGEISSNSRTSRRHVPHRKRLQIAHMRPHNGRLLAPLPKPPSATDLCILFSSAQLSGKPQKVARKVSIDVKPSEYSDTDTDQDMIVQRHIDGGRASAGGGRGSRLHSDVERDHFSPLLSLPNETLHTVCEYLPSSSLLSLLRVCRRLHGISERLLYTNISITESVDSNTVLPSPSTIITPHSTLALCNSVGSRPYLAPCIRRLAVRWTRDRARKNEVLNLPPSTIPSLHVLLYHSHHIESLELHLAGWRGGYDELLSGCSFRLKSLALSGPLNAPIEWFLSSQPGIVYLHLGDHHAPLNLSPLDLPHLETFRGDALAAASILPGRPVLGLALSGYEPSERSLISLAYTKFPIRCLDLSGLSVTPTQLLTISKHLTALETLRMRLALRHTLHFAFSGLMLLSALTQVLGAFQNLAHLDLSPTSVVGVVGLHNEGEEHQLCNSWAAVCPSLRCVRFPSGTEWVFWGPKERYGVEDLWRPTIREGQGSPRVLTRLQ